MVLAMKTRLASRPRAARSLAPVTTLAGFVTLASVVAVTACGSAARPAAEPASGTPSATAPAPASEPAPPTPHAQPDRAAAPVPSGGAGGAGTAAAPPEMVTASVTGVSNEIVTPNVVSPDKVIANLRPKLDACYAAGLKKDPKLAGSVTLAAKIEKDGKVSAVTPKQPEGLSPAVLKCLTEAVKAANFAVSGGMSYATSIDIPVHFATN
jgi:hypothetical protein